MFFFEGEKFRGIKLACLVDCGNYFHERKNLEKATKYYRKALGIDPQNYYANIGLAAALAANKSFRESLDSLQKAISIKKNDIWTLVLMFVAYEGLREENAANEALKDILKYFDNNETAAFDRLSYTYFELNMLREAEYYIKKALQISPTDAGLHYNLGKIYFAEEMFDEARHEFHKTLELSSSKNEKCLRKYAIYYLKEIRNQIGDPPGGLGKPQGEKWKKGRKGGRT